MSKVIEVDLTLSDLTDDNVRVAEEEHLLSVSGTTDLSASFSKDSLLALFDKMDGCDGFRLYPAANNNELIMIAWGTKDGNDLVGEDDFCVAANAQGMVAINGVPEQDGIQQLPTTLANFLLMGSGSGPAVVTELNEIRQIDETTPGLKVLFDSSFVTDEKEAFDEIVFELVDVKLQDTLELKRTIIGYAKTADDEFLKGVSFLPCPPNCDHTYGQKQVILEVPPSAT